MAYLFGCRQGHRIFDYKYTRTFSRVRFRRLSLHFWNRHWESSKMMRLVAACLLLVLFSIQSTTVRAVTKIDPSSYKELFVCRIRVTNLAARSLAVRIGQDRGSTFEPQFELASYPGQPSLVWRSADVGDTDDTAEVIYRAFMPDTSDVVAFTYSNFDGAISDDQLTIHCSNASRLNGTSHLRFVTSYNVTLGSPTNATKPTHGDGRVRRPAKLVRTVGTDCWDPNGFVHPNSLEPVQRYVADGEQYESGACTFINTCSDGELSGVSRCPPHYPSYVKFAEVRTIGRCCHDAVSKSDVEAATCPSSTEALDGYFETEGRQNGSSAGGYPYRPVPWQVRFGDDDRKCDGIIISKSWFLTTDACLDQLPTARFYRPASVVYQPPAFRNVTVAEWTYLDVDKNESAIDHSQRLILVRINDSFITNDWTTGLQRINLPWSQPVCQQFQAGGCRVVLGVADEISSNQSNVVVATVAAVKASSAPRVKPVKKAEPRAVLTGSGAVGWYKRAFFLTGVYAQEKKTTGESIEGSIISVCPYLDAIRDVIGKIED